MASLFLGARVLSIMGTDILIRGISATSSSIGGALRSIYDYDKPGIDVIKKELATVDLQYHITVIEELVKECEGKDLATSISKAIHGVSEILDKIDTELKYINDAIYDHEKKYFNRWRSFNCKYNINQIKAQKKLLDHRYKILIDLLMIYHN